VHGEKTMRVFRDTFRKALLKALPAR